MSNDTNFTTGDEPLLGDVAPLSDEAWDGLLEDTFLAPPGAADYLVDSLEATEPADLETDLSPTGASADGDAAAVDTEFGYDAHDDAIDPDALSELDSEHPEGGSTDGTATESATGSSALGTQGIGVTDGELDVELLDQLVSGAPAATATSTGDGADAGSGSELFSFEHLDLDLTTFDSGAFDATDAAIDADPHTMEPDASFTETTELPTGDLDDGLEADTGGDLLG